MCVAPGIVVGGPCGRKLGSFPSRLDFRFPRDVGPKTTIEGSRLFRPGGTAQGPQTTSTDNRRAHGMPGAADASNCVEFPFWRLFLEVRLDFKPAPSVVWVWRRVEFIQSLAFALSGVYGC